MGRTAIISIHPAHIANILSGKKVFEYRKVIPKHDISRLVLYCTAPIKKIVAVAEVLDCVVGPPTRVWSATSFGSGISRRFFRTYFSGQRNASAFVLGNVYKMASPIDLADLTGQMKPPQSFFYLDEASVKLISQQQSSIPAVPPSLIFVGGIHGVGKSTVCQKTFVPAGYQCIAASSLIATAGMETDQDKHVDHVGNNQAILLQELVLAKKKYCRLLLDGHFTLINRLGNIEPVAHEIFEGMRPNELILIKGCPDEIASRLKERDGKKWDASFLASFQAQEEEHARYVSEKVGIPLHVFNNDAGVSAFVNSIRGNRLRGLS